MAVAGCCGCVFLLLFVALPWYAGGELISKHKVWAADLYVNCTDYPEHFCPGPEGYFWTPQNGTRYLAWGGCGQGYKTDAELNTCGGTCFNGSLPINMDAFNAKHGMEMVTFPARKGTEGQPSEQISAWWLPSGKLGAPRVVVQHGNNANENSRMVQTAAYLLRSMGFDVLVPSLGSHGHAETVEDFTSWGWSYPFDLLGAWDYAVSDPEGKLGGAVDPSKVGLMGFSMGGFVANTAFGMEGRVPGVWTDGAVFSPENTVEAGVSFLGPFAGPVASIALAFGKMSAGVDLAAHTPAKEFPTGPKTQRKVMLVTSSRDTFVPITETEQYKTLLEGLSEQYSVHEWIPEAVCNGNAHCAAEFAFAAQDRSQLCSFWTTVFNLEESYCGLDSLPSFDAMTPAAV